MASNDVPDDLKRLSRMTLRLRKVLWIGAVPLAAVSLFWLEKSPWAGGAMLFAAVVLGVIARSRRSPRRQHGIRLLLEEPHLVDRIVIQETPGIAQIAFARGDGLVSMLEIEDPKRFQEALDIVTAHLPGVTLDYQTYEGKRFIFADWKFWNRW